MYIKFNIIKKILLTVILTSIKSIVYSIEIGFENSAYAYNNEHGAYWEQTQSTITYFENRFEPFFRIRFENNIYFKFGIGLLIPFDQESKIKEYFPVVQTKISNENFSFTIGTLDNNHNFPSPVRDPLMTFIPALRQGTNQIKIDYERFPLRIQGGGYYEYGLSLKWYRFGEGEFYINWEFADTINHRERIVFALSQSYTFGILPLYFSIYYWHNGGHENPHVIDITETYLTSIGLRNNDFNLLYINSFNLPDRDSRPELNYMGHAFYFDINLKIFDIIISPIVFLSYELLDVRYKFYSPEGDPFFKVPIYIGFNIAKEFKINDNINITIKFVNAYYQPKNAVVSYKNIRYDQMIKIDIKDAIIFKK